MFRRLLVLIGALALVCAFGMFTPAAVKADCVPDLVAGDDSIVCDDTTLVSIGDNVAALLIGVGNINANGDFTIVSGGDGVGLVLIGLGDINANGDFTIVSGSSSIAMVLIGQGNINANGDFTIVGGDFALGQLLLGLGNINSTGNLQVVGGSVALGQLLLGMGDINSTGDLQVVGGDLALGQLLLGVGNLTNNGNVQIVGGDLALGQLLLGVGDLTNNGDVQVVGGLLGLGQVVIGQGDLTNNGDLQVVGGWLSLGQVVIGLGNLTNNGNIEIASGGLGVGQLLIGAGDITSNGNISVNRGAGIVLIGNGNITSSGDITVGNGIAILGGPGSQHVEVDGAINAPLAIVLDGGNDTLYLRSNSNVQGWVGVGAGDDIVVIGDHAVVSNTIWGGDTAEVSGDLLVIGDGQVCAEDSAAVAAAEAFAAGLVALDPENGTVSYLGQSYSWLEFEQLMGGSYVSPCFGKINDGRINAYDLGAPDALYCTVGGGLSVWEIDLEGNGTFSFAVTAEQIQAAFEAAVSSGENQVIGSDSFGNTLYALSEGQNITFTATELREEGKTYMHMFNKERCAIPA